METLENELILIHQEGIRNDAMLRQALKQSGMINPPIFRHAISALGEALIRVGTRLKEQPYTRLSADESTVPSFLIAL
jgi:hypothetical protein